MMMRKLAVLAGALLGLGLGVGRAAEVEELLPESTVLAVRISDWAKTRKAFEATALGKTLGEEEVKDAFSGARRILDEFVAKVEKAAGVKRDLLERAFGRGLTLALVNLTEGAGAGPLGSGPNGAVVILAEVGDAEAAAKAGPAVTKMMTGGLEGEALAWAGVKGRKVKLSPAEGLGLYCLRAKGRWAWVFSANEAPARELAAALAAGKRAKSLAGAPLYRLCRKTVGGGGDLFLYLNMEEFLKQLGELIAAEDRAHLAKFTKATGGADLRAVAWSFGVQPPGFRSRSFFACRPEAGGLLGLVESGKLPKGLLEIVPSGASAVTAGGLHPGKILPLIRGIMVAVDEKRAAKEFDKFLPEFKRELGFDLKEGLIDTLGRRYCLYVLPPSAAPGNPLLAQVNGAVLAWELKDAAAAARLRASSDALMQRVNRQLGGGPDGGPMSTFEYRKQKVYSIDCEGVANPGFTVTDEYLLVGGNVAAVKKALVRLGLKDKAASAITADEKFKKAVGRVKLAGACSVTYHDASKDLGTVLALARMIGPELARELARNRGRREAPDSMGRLGLVNDACRAWAADHDGALPPDLVRLLPDYLEESGTLRCPDYCRHAAGGVDYGYFAGLKTGDKGDLVVAYESVAAEDGSVNALFLDGRVQNLALKELRKQLEEQKARLIKAGRKVKLVEPKKLARGIAVPDLRVGEFLLDLLAAVLSPDKFPSSDALGKHMFPSAAVARRVRGGLLLEGFSPLGTPTGVDLTDSALTGSLTSAALYPALVEVRASAKMATSKSNLRQIGLACHMYADDADEVFPKKDLNQLVPNYVDNRKVFLCPHYKKHATDKIDYAYVVGLKATDPGSAVLGYEVQPGPGRRVNVLYCDAHVEAKTVPALRRTLAKQFGRLKSQGRKWKVIEPKGIKPAFSAAKIKPLGKNWP
jgi:prepilin-type processing-associated H-X9-DG protein